MAADGPELGDLLSLGLTLALCLVVGYGLGWLVDLLAGSFPIFALVGIALGIVVACLYFYKMFKRFQ
ncbi:AtpZ/AtpI family protein [Pseudonocardia sp. GCM10023141]|uniref:AtpZ/AtpI family protein n=1 Tax=Pseudonocardia sp. GCM10023141 TaxID=3252653 RepID=UPI00362028A6